ncbi:MAG: signal peptide peptidase SppA, partial [Spirochaetaceae bacterium]|nr:signal peptide peptidase SppA [Spirochaetaceae bacterium]
MRYATVTLSGTYRESAPPVRSPLASLSGKVFRFDRFFLQTKSLVASRRVDRVLIVTDSSFKVGFVAGLESIRDLLGQLVDAGKEVWFHSIDYSDAHLYLASRCTNRVMHPLGAMRCVGLFRTAFFFKQALDRYGVQIQVARRGRYKSASDRFRLESIDPLNRQQYQAWMDVGAKTLHDAIVEGYGKPREDLETLLQGRILDAQSALTDGWVDRVSTLGKLTAEWHQQKLRTRRSKTPHHIGRGKTVAVLVIEGAIRRGKSSFNPLFGASVGSESFVKSIKTLEKSKSIRSVVLRINSGGGDAAASEEIRVALGRLAAVKPLTVSMSEVAGSGGYWIATPGTTIFAEKSTLTGSIGVIALSIAFRKPLEHFGVTHSVLTTHGHADAQSGMRPLSEAEFSQLDRHVESIYSRFLKLVSESRGQNVDTVREHAEGRIWSGSDAVKIGLVDHVGGLDAAIDGAKAAAGVGHARVAFYPRIKRSFLQRLVTRPFAGLSLPAARLPDIHDVFELAGKPLLIQPESVVPLFGTDGISSGIRDLDI